MLDTASSITQQMKALKDKEAILQKKLDRLNALPVEHRLAEELHAEMCHADHTDRCGYTYGNDFTQGEKKRWVEKAEELLLIESDFEKVLLIAAILKKY